MATEKKNLTWIIAPGLTVLAFVGGFGAQFVLMKSSIGTVQAAQTRVEERVTVNEGKLHKIEIDTAIDNTDIKTIKDDIAEIKKDIKAILNSKK